MQEGFVSIHAGIVVPPPSKGSTTKSPSLESAWINWTDSLTGCPQGWKRLSNAPALISNCGYSLTGSFWKIKTGFVFAIPTLFSFHPSSRIPRTWISLVSRNVRSLDRTFFCSSQVKLPPYVTRKAPGFRTFFAIGFESPVRSDRELRWQSTIEAFQWTWDLQ